MNAREAARTAIKKYRPSEALSEVMGCIARYANQGCFCTYIEDEICLKLTWDDQDYLSALGYTLKYEGYPRRLNISWDRPFMSATHTDSGNPTDQQDHRENEDALDFTDPTTLLAGAVVANELLDDGGE